MNYTRRPPATSFGARTGALKLRRYLRGRSLPTPPTRVLGPWLRDLSVAQLKALAWGSDRHRAESLVELTNRARTDDAAVTALGDLSRLPALHEDRPFHLVSLSWAAITGLLAVETPRSRRLAYSAFIDLDPDDRRALLRHLRAPSIEQAHPLS